MLLLSVAVKGTFNYVHTLTWKKKKKKEQSGLHQPKQCFKIVVDQAFKELFLFGTGCSMLWPLPELEALMCVEKLNLKLGQG